MATVAINDFWPHWPQFAARPLPEVRRNDIEVVRHQRSRPGRPTPICCAFDSCLAASPARDGPMALDQRPAKRQDQGLLRADPSKLPCKELGFDKIA